MNTVYMFYNRNIHPQASIIYRALSEIANNDDCRSMHNTVSALETQWGTIETNLDTFPWKHIKPNGKLFKGWNRRGIQAINIFSNVSALSLVYKYSCVHNSIASPNVAGRQAHGIISQRNQFCACDVAHRAQQNSLIALFVMMPVFYVAGNELILSVRCFSSFNPVW